ncbi:LysR family transcriptional regulator [Raoultella ornithinolytica]|uniref:LysR family transcriptional regulator n=1 Tax=Raoultella ornithinolytica TaxID=54291 RepID=UPI000FEB7339|nr:LysR family transcriptional regulator [Raoultella ornithinolytica]RWS98231.1 LysR family transcriptional regulator [Raoultella ornithinolytica]
MDQLTSIRVFVKAAETGSFAAAAGQLRLSPQMVARHVAALEAHLGTSLIARTTRRQTLTDIGRSYYERCRVVLAEIAEADAVAQEMKATPSGIIRVNAPVTFGSHALAAFITDYLARYPDVQVELTLSDRIVDPIEEEFEVIVRIGELADSSMVAWPLLPYRLIACASPDYILRHGEPQTPTDLQHHACLVYGHWSAGSACRWRFEKQGEMFEVKPSGRFRANDWKALMNAAIAGHGITLGPEDVLKTEVERGSLVQVLAGFSGPARPMHILVPARRRRTTKIKCFVDALRAALGPR